MRDGPSLRKNKRTELELKVVLSTTALNAGSLSALIAWVFRKHEPIDLFHLLPSIGNARQA